jgi:two-component system cell cycle sensor histidine kinase/response regulator CckA
VNAWQAMPDGGQLYIQTRNCELDDKFVNPFSLKDGKYVEISVGDTGIGMDDATCKRIFEPFFTTKERERGTGLGLASAYGIIKNHDGIITAQSKKGKGTTFTIYLPASEKVFCKTKVLSEEQMFGSGMILLVDDEEMIIEVGKAMLEKLGYDTLIAGGGKEAIEIYRKNRDTISLVILDMIMPRLSGSETYERLKEINPDIKILLSSGYSIDGAANKILKGNDDGFIQKPFNIKKLSSKVQQVLSKS